MTRQIKCVYRDQNVTPHGEMCVRVAMMCHGVMVLVYGCNSEGLGDVQVTVTRGYKPFQSHWFHAKVVNFQLHESVSDISACSPLLGVHSHHIEELYKIEKQQQSQ